MKKSFSINLLFLLTVNLLIKPVYLFGIEVGVQNEVGAEAYGMYYAMFNFTFLFNVILDLGMNNYQKIKVAQDADSGMQNMATLLPLKLFLSLVYMLVTITTAFIVGFNSDYWFFIIWLMINHVLSTYLLLLRSNLAGLQLFFRDSLVSVTDRLLMVVGIGYLLWFGTQNFDIRMFVVAQTLAYVVAIVFALLMLPRGARFFKLNFSLKQARSMVLKTWPFALLILMMTAYHKLDGIMLERLSSNGLLEAGIYAQAFRILDAGNNFAFLYAGLLLPMFAKLFHKDQPELLALVDQASRLLIIPAGIVAVVAYFESEWIMDLLYDQHVQPASMSLKWLMGSFVWMAMSYVFGTLMTASTKLRRLNWIAFITVLLNVLLNWYLIPRLGAEGAAMASFMSLGFMALAQLIESVTLFNAPVKNWLSRAIVILTLTFLSGFACEILQLSSLLQTAIMIGVSAIGFLTFGVDLKEIIASLKSRSTTQ